MRRRSRWTVDFHPLNIEIATVSLIREFRCPRNTRSPGVIAGAFHQSRAGAPPRQTRISGHTPQLKSSHPIGCEYDFATVRRPGQARESLVVMRQPADFAACGHQKNVAALDSVAAAKRHCPAVGRHGHTQVASADLPRKREAFFLTASERDAEDALSPKCGRFLMNQQCRTIR